jgi:hypothetical protein
MVKGEKIIEKYVGKSWDACTLGKRANHPMEARGGLEPLRLVPVANTGDRNRLPHPTRAVGYMSVWHPPAWTLYSQVRN